MRVFYNFIKNVLDSIINPLQHVINESFSHGIFPSQLKIAKVIPLFKSGDPLLPDNYRPISLLPNFSKIFEKVAFIRLTTFLENNKLISKYQFGFRKSHSTIHPLIHFVNGITDALNKKQHTIAIFCQCLYRPGG